MFSDITDFDAVSGNIINQIADHFAQCLILKQNHIEYKNTNFISLIIPIFKWKMLLMIFLIGTNLKIQVKMLMLNLLSSMTSSLNM